MVARSWVYQARFVVRGEPAPVRSCLSVDSHQPKVGGARLSPTVFPVERKSVTPERDAEGVSGNGGVGFAVGLVVAAVRRDRAGTGGV